MQAEVSTIEQPPLKVLTVVLEYEPTDDAEERLLAIFEYLLAPEKTLDFER